MVGFCRSSSPGAARENQRIGNAIGGACALLSDADISNLSPVSGPIRGRICRSFAHNRNVGGEGRPSTVSGEGGSTISVQVSTVNQLILTSQNLFSVLLLSSCHFARVIFTATTHAPPSYRSRWISASASTARCSTQ